MPPLRPTIGESTAKHHPERADGKREHALKGTSLLYGPRVRSDQERGQPRTDAVVHGRGTRESERQCPNGSRVRAQIRNHLGEWRLCRRACLCGVRARRARLANRQCEERDQQARQADEEEHELPWIHRTDQRNHHDSRFVHAPDHVGTERIRHTRSEERAHHVRAHRHAESLLRKLVRDDRHGGRAECGFARAHADAGKEQVPVTARRTGEHGHHAPDRRAERHDTRAMASVHPSADRQPQQRIEDDEAKPHEQADLRIRDLEVTFDGLDE